MKYVLDQENVVIAIHENDQNMEGLYPGLRVVLLKEFHDLDETIPLPADYGAAFEAACAQFRKVCSMIGDLIRNPDFRGGFDEFNEFRKTEAAKTSEGISLSLDWNAANECCVYEAKKLGLGQPEWWYRCWSEADRVGKQR